MRNKTSSTNGKAGASYVFLTNTARRVADDGGSLFIRWLMNSDSNGSIPEPIYYSENSPEIYLFSYCLMPVIVDDNGFKTMREMLSYVLSLGIKAQLSMLHMVILMGDKATRKSSGGVDRILLTSFDLETIDTNNSLIVGGQ